MNQDAANRTSDIIHRLDKAKPEKPADGYCLIHPTRDENGQPPPFWINQAQYYALNRKFLQSPDGSPNFAEFRARARMGFEGVVMIHWCGMWLGIEKDGYTHS